MINFSLLPNWVYLLTLVSMLIFWLIIKVLTTKKKQKFTPSSDYFEGLNHLLNDEQTKALDIFVKLVESNWEMIDTHFALGKIYRKNGEMDKAIKIHQGLIARPSLPENYRSALLLELGYDYLGAGWLDRAEGLFKEVLIQDKNSIKARHNLILIYQQEKDWFKAIAIAIDFADENPKIIKPMIAHYYCELADICNEKGDNWQLENYTKKALTYDKNCVRANIILAQQAQLKSDYEQAISYYKKIEKQDLESIALILDSMHLCYEKQSALESFYDYLLQLELHYPDLFLQNKIATVIKILKNKQSAESYLLQKIKKQPNLKSIELLLNYKKQKDKSDSSIEQMALAIKQMQQQRSDYQCKKCGFSSNTHYWLCPRCNHWGNIKPIINKCRTLNNSTIKATENNY